MSGILNDPDPATRAISIMTCDTYVMKYNKCVA